MADKSRFDFVYDSFTFTFTAHGDPNLDQVCRAVLGKSLDQATAATGLSERIYEFLRAADAKELLNKAIVEARNRVQSSMIEDAYIKYCGAVRAGTEPFDACWIPPRKTLIDRKNIRDAARLLVTGEIRVLLINGVTKTGKTYCSNLMRHISEESRKAPGGWSANTRHALCEIDLNDHGTSIPGRDALQLIYDEIGDPSLKLPKQVAADARWFLTRINGLKPVLERGRLVLWLVIDGLDRAKKTDQIRAFAQSYATLAAKSTQLRAIFIECAPATLPLKILEDRDFVEEHVHEVKLEELEDFYGQLRAQLAKPLEPKDLAKEAWKEANDTVAAGKGKFMSSLSEAARKHVLKILQAP